MKLKIKKNIWPQARTIMSILKAAVRYEPSNGKRTVNCLQSTAVTWFYGTVWESNHKVHTDKKLL